MIVTLILFVIILGVTVFVHELGHFLFAKLVGVHVYEFSIGMGPAIVKKVAKDKTVYAIRAIPIGGFVSLAGEETNIDLDKQKGHNLQDKTVFERFFFAISCPVAVPVITTICCDGNISLTFFIKFSIARTSPTETP